jgi:Protein of unknown function (DUF3108)
MDKTHRKMNIIKVVKIGFMALSLTWFASSFNTQDNAYPIKNTSFAKGERLEYRLHYGLLTGGYPVLQVGDKAYTVDGKPCHRIEVSGKSAGAVHKLFKVNDLWRAYVDTATMLPKYAYRNIQEDNYKLVEDTYLNRGIGKTKVDKQKSSGKSTQTYNTPEGIHDIVSGFFYFRNVDWAKKQIGEKVTIQSFFEEELYTINVVYKGVVELKTDLGKINCYKLMPEVPKNELFNGDDSIIFYLSADKNKIPIKIKANMFVGAIEMDLLKHHNLRHPIQFK